MRLELKAVGGDIAIQTGRAKWFFESGRRTIGRSPDCDWQVPQEQRSVSKLHCTIERDAQGFILRDQSANGSRVDGIVVHEGETARLSDQSRLEVGSVAFSVHISGEVHRDIEDPDTSYAMSDETLTISSILADISPGGRTATGVLGNKVSEDWLEPIARKEGSSPSRNVDIGWNGPPDVRGSGNILPDDWHLEDGGGGGHSDYSTHLEHGSATHVAVPVSRIRPVAPPVESRAAEALLTVNDNAPPAEPEKSNAFTPFPLGRSAELGQKLDPLLHRLEEALEASFSAFGLGLPGSGAEPQLFNRDGEDALVARVEELAARQAKLQSALEILVHHAEQTMEPRIIEARIDAAAGPLSALSFLRGRYYWQAYTAQFERNGRALSVRDVFRDAMTRTEGTNPTTDLPAEEKEDRSDEK
jgi:type VI secretion system protein ImpI